MALRRFILRSLLALLPVIIFIGTYAVLDPFKVIYRYDEPAAPSDTVALGHNAGFASIKCLERNLKSGRTYDSFILGSSMSQAYSTREWSQHLPAGASIFHLDASEETLQGMLDKLRYLHDHGIKVSNALIIIEEAMLHRDPNDTNFLFVRPSSTTPDVNWVQFQLAFFEVYKNPTFIGYSIAPERFRSTMLKKRMATAVLETHIDSTNENIFTSVDSLIAVDPDAYFTAKRLKSNYFAPTIAPERPGISPERERIIEQIAAMLHDGGTVYRVIVPPRFNRQQLHPCDLAVLHTHFGAQRVHDYSHHPCSTDPRAYYDWAAHLTTSHCTALLHDAYTTSH